MRLEFNSCNELAEFLEFSRMIGAGTRSAGNEPPIPSPATVSEEEQLPPAEPETSTDDNAPKRKRRTKAEIEADKAAAEQPAAGTPSDDAAAAQTSPSADDNPFAAQRTSPAVQAILNAPDQRTATLAGMAAMQSGVSDASASETSEAVAASAAGDVTEFLEARAAELLTANPQAKAVEHLKKCQEFIGAHGRARYDESFTLTGLPKTIATFKAPEIAKHQAALEYLQLA